MRHKGTYIRYTTQSTWFAIASLYLQTGCITRELNQKSAQIYLQSWWSHLRENNGKVNTWNQSAIIFCCSPISVLNTPTADKEDAFPVRHKVEDVTHRQVSILPLPQKIEMDTFCGPRISNLSQELTIKYFKVEGQCKHTQMIELLCSRSPRCSWPASNIPKLFSFLLLPHFQIFNFMHWFCDQLWIPYFGSP